MKTETDGNQMTTQSSGHNRGSAAQDSPSPSPSSAALSVEQHQAAKQAIKDALEAAWQDLHDWRRLAEEQRKAHPDPSHAPNMPSVAGIEKTKWILNALMPAAFHALDVDLSDHQEQARAKELGPCPTGSACVYSCVDECFRQKREKERLTARAVPLWHRDDAALKAETDPELQRLIGVLTDATNPSSIDKIVATRQLIRHLRAAVSTEGGHDKDHGGTGLTEVDSVSVSVHAPQLPHDATTRITESVKTVWLDVAIDDLYCHARGKACRRSLAEVTIDIVTVFQRITNPQFGKGLQTYIDDLIGYHGKHSLSEAIGSAQSEAQEKKASTC